MQTFHTTFVRNRRTILDDDCPLNVEKCVGIRLVWGEGRRAFWPTLFAAIFFRRRLIVIGRVCAIAFSSPRKTRRVNSHKLPILPRHDILVEKLTC